jgi:hypothetical protein
VELDAVEAGPIPEVQHIVHAHHHHHRHYGRRASGIHYGAELVRTGLSRPGIQDHAQKIGTGTYRMLSIRATANPADLGLNGHGA